MEAGGHPRGLGSEELREGVLRSFMIQRVRYRGMEGIRRNADVSVSRLEEFCPMTGRAEQLLSDAQRKLLFSARGRRNIIQVARTIADLEGSGLIEDTHIGEAVQYRIPRFLEG
jgi:magnesium chelatase family protein